MAASLKQQFVASARKLGVLPALEAVKFAGAALGEARANRSFMAAHPGFTPPPLWWVHDMYSHASYEKYWLTGEATGAALQALVERHCHAPAPRIADWGCGLARVIRHLPSAWARAGFDYNERAIDWCADNIPDIRFSKNNLMPQLEAGNAAFDCVYALSVFTHLSAEAHAAWIKEIHRVLAPGGIFIGAFHMRPGTGQLSAAEQARFDKGELVARGGVLEGSRIYTAYHPEAYLRDELFHEFEIAEGPIEFFGQTAFVIRKI